MSGFIKLTQRFDWASEDIPDSPIIIAIDRITIVSQSEAGETWVHVCLHSEMERPCDPPEDGDKSDAFQVAETVADVFAMLAPRAR